MSFITGGYELFVPVITIFNANAVNPGISEALYFCSLSVKSSSAGATAVSGVPSSLNAVQATSPSFLTSSALVVRKYILTALEVLMFADKRISSAVDSFSNITGFVIYFAAALPPVVVVSSVK